MYQFFCPVDVIMMMNRYAHQIQKKKIRNVSCVMDDSLAIVPLGQGPTCAVAPRRKKKESRDPCH